MRKVNKKAALFALIALLVLLLSVSVSLLLGGKKPVPLPKPDGFTLSGTLLTWNAVEHANGYTVRISDGIERGAESNSYALDYLVKNQQYMLRVKALGDGKRFADSDYSGEFPFFMDGEGRIMPVITNVRLRVQTTLYPGGTLPELDADISVPGSVALDPVQALVAGTFDYRWIFIPEDEELYLTAEGFIELTVAKGAPTLEDNVKAIATSETSLRVFEPQGKKYEYSLDGISWQSEYDFHDLEKDRTYTVYVRVKESELDLASNSITGEVKTYPFSEIFTYSGNKITGLHERGREYEILVIPEVINGVEITGIAEGALKGNGKVTDVIILGNITQIGFGAFEGCDKLQRLTLPFVGDSSENPAATHLGYIFGAAEYAQNSAKTPASLTDVEVTGARLGTRAFYNCVNILSVKLGDGLLEIGNFAFENCAGLKAIDLNMAESVNGSIFADCRNLTEITVSADNPAYFFSDGCLLSKPDGGKTLVIGTGSPSVPHNVTAIAAYAFYKNPVIAELEASPNLTAIGENAFYRCTSLASVSAASLQYVGASAFEDCGSLVRVTLESVSEVGERAFKNCAYLSQVSLASASVIGDEAFRNCKSLSRVTELAQSVGAAVGNYAFAGSGLTEIPLGNVTDIGDYAFSGLTVLRAADLSSVTRLGKYAFNLCRGIVGEVPLSAELREIGMYAFYGCAGITSVNLSGVETIGAYAFHGCKGLTSLDLSGLKSMGVYAFYDCINVSGKVPLSDELTVIPRFAFYNCSKISEIDLKNVVTIGNSAFMHCSGLYYVDLAKIETVDVSAFNSSGLKQLALPASVTDGSLGMNSFANTQKLTSADLSSARLTTLDHAFAGSGITSVILPDSLSTVGDSAFKNCQKLAEIDLKNVTGIGVSAFENCVSLAEIDLKNINNIGDNAFSGCSSLTFADLSKAISIGKNAFYYCANLHSVVFAEITNIGLSAFSNCSKLENFFHFGNGETDWRQSITYLTGNVVLTRSAAKWHYYSEAEPAENKSGYWRYADGKPEVWQ